MAESVQTNSDVATDYATFRYSVLALLSRTATATIVRVVACTNAGGVSPVGTVDVQPLIQMRAGDGSLWDHGQLFRLPYVRVQGGTNAVILDPQPGDLGLAWFASRDISALKASPATYRGTGGALGAPPGSQRQFDMSDGMYMGGILNGAPTSWVRFTTGGDVEVLSPGKVTIQAPTIELKGAVVQTDGDVSMSGTATVAVDVIGGGISLKNHTHGGVTAGGANTAVPNP